MSEQHSIEESVDPCPVAGLLPTIPFPPIGLTPDNAPAIARAFAEATREVVLRLHHMHRTERFRPRGVAYELSHNAWTKGSIVQLWNSQNGNPNEGILCLNRDLELIEVDIQTGIEETLATQPGVGNGGITLRSRCVPKNSELYRVAVAQDPRLADPALELSRDGEPWATIYEVSGDVAAVRASIISAKVAQARSRDPQYFRISEGLFYRRGNIGLFDLEIGAGTNAMIASPASDNRQLSMVVARTVPIDGADYREAVHRDPSLANPALMFELNGTQCATIYDISGDPEVFRVRVLSPSVAAAAFDVVRHLGLGDKRATIQPLLKALAKTDAESLLRRLTSLGSYGSDHPLFLLSELRETLELGTTIDAVDNATYDFGPLYNARDGRGYLVSDIFSSSQCPTSEEGFGAFLGLRGLGSGEIDLRFERPSSSHGPLLFPEDVNAILALAFGSDAITNPSFSLDRRVEQVGAMRPLNTLATRNFSPHWLEHTAFGQTLYATDYWLGKIAAQPLLFLHLTEPFENRPADTKDLLAALLKLRGTSGCLRIVPNSLETAWAMSPDNQTQCRVRSASMYVYGWPQSDIGKEGADVAGANDPGTEIGQVAIFLTNNYDHLARSWPIFERLRQLTSLLHCTFELKRRGFEPGEALVDRARGAVAQFEAHRPSKSIERLVRWNSYPDI